MMHVNGEEIELILCTAPAEKADLIARLLVDERFVACVNIQEIRSVFRWEGEVQVEDEMLLICKTTTGRREETFRRLREIHPYDVPEILALPVKDGDPRYCSWVRAEVSG